MRRFERKISPLLYAGVALSLTVTAAADHFAGLGIAVYILYMVPVTLAFFTWKSWMPMLTAFAASLLIALDFWLTPDGAMEDVARLNRVFGVITVLSLGGIGMQFVLTRLAVRRQDWLQAGQAQLSQQLLGEQNLNQLGDSALRLLCEYLDAKAGAIFVEDDKFRLFATYGAAPGSVPESFETGEGLLGQAAKDKRNFLIHNIPQGYLSIGSGLGKAPPRHLLVGTGKADGSVNTVLELGFVRAVTAEDTAFIDSVSETLGIAVRSAKYRRRLQELLEETRQQSQELQAQSEELRVSNEELEEQSHSLRESQAQLELQQVELEQTNTQLEEQTQLLEAQKAHLSGAKIRLEEQARVLEQASRYKSNFLSNMSHELRTPLNSSLILAKMLADNREGNLSAEQVKFATSIQTSGNDLLSLINDVLDLAKVEAGHMQLRPAELHVGEIIANLRSTFEPVTRQKGLNLSFRVSGDVPVSFETDPQRLEQVLRNLLSNALKFTEKGNVALEVTAIPGLDRLAFAVKDSGIGIPHDQQVLVFEPFCQADGTANRKYGGTGLGLSISRELAHLLGGEIQLGSEPGSGSTFTVTVPLRLGKSSSSPIRPAPPVAPLPTPTNGLPPPRPACLIPDDRENLSGNRRVVLIVEDDLPFAEILAGLARELKFQFLVATTAEEGLMLAHEHSPGAIILDVGLPDDSGLMVLERLKRDARTRHIPVHVVSAGDYMQTALALGAVGYMIKPVKREELASVFEKLDLRLTQKLRRVLVVEDDALQLESMKLLLSSPEVETVGALTAADCLAKLRDTTFDCMVLDLSLPDASGFSLLETLSAETKYSFPPVIVYTGRELEPGEEERLRRYSRSIIIKGARSPERLLDEVTLFLHQVVSDLPKEQQKMLEKAQSREAALDGRHILMVEDDVRNIFALTSFLEPYGVKLQIARNGLEALDLLRYSFEGSAPPVELVLMDMMMPEMDGLTAMTEIRKLPQWKKLPIIALTAKAMKNDQEQCLAAGANDYLAKPLDVEKLLSLIRVWMPR